MSVEDIEYLYEHSEKDNFILYIDSSLRNQDYYPRPNQYTIQFDQPFKFVYGIDILDASIPSTMYNIESDANHVSGLTFSLNPNSSTNGYTFQELLTELSEFDEFDTLFYSTTIAQQISGGADSKLTGQVVVTNNELLNQWPEYINNNYQLNTESNGYYYVFVREEIKGLTIFKKADEHLFEYPVWDFTHNEIDYQIGNNLDDANVQDFISIYTTQQYRYILKQNSDNTYDFVYYKTFNVPISTTIRLKTYSDLVVYMAHISLFYVEYTPGNYGATNFIDEAKKAFGGTNVAISAQSSSDISIRPKVMFTSEFNFVLNMDNSTARTSMGFDEYAVTTMPSLYTKYTYKENKRVFGANYYSGDQTYKLIAPGVIYLLGTRYVILRCPEIEGHMYASRSFGQFSPGIGMFKMYAVNDIAHQRFDFVNFQKKPFHPIGKLDRLTLKFEKVDGTMYDFKGANHLLLMNIKYLVPSQKKKFERSVLNPNYTYDFNSYLSRRLEYKETSEDGNDDMDPSEFREKYGKIEKEYDYSSSDDEDEEDSDDSEVDVKRVFRN